MTRTLAFVLRWTVASLAVLAIVAAAVGLNVVGFNAVGFNAVGSNAVGFKKDPRTSEGLRREYDAQTPKSILQLQPFRQTSSIPIGPGGGGAVTLVNLNPAINIWYVLYVRSHQGAPEVAYHLENPRPQSRGLLLDEKVQTGLVIVDGGSRSVCDLLGSGGALEKARNSGLVFSPLCESRLYLRNPTTGHRTTLEAATELLRDHVWGGEKLVSLGHFVLGERYRETGNMQAAPPSGPDSPGNSSDRPIAAAINSQYANQGLTSPNLGIALQSPARAGMTPGAWYAAAANAGIYVSVIRPNLIDPRILQTHKSLVNNLDDVEASALCYLIAFDLDQFDLGYALGTDHPRVGWSDRTLPRMRDPKLPGPDGIGNVSPLVATGLVNPATAPATAAAFAAGFKRHHGAFKYGDLAQVNHGSHYGFIENGVVFSKLQPGVATIFVLDSGATEMKTWDVADNPLLPHIKYARQNGVPLVETDAASKTPVPGRLVNRWGPGNWSGSEDMQLRTVRSGAALQNSHGKRFLVYAVFSDATPSAMARVFQAYQCQYAMLLDMNSLEHTYLAVYRRAGGRVFVDHLLKGMSEGESAGGLVPRFLAAPDNRDFFYLTSRRASEGKK